MSAMKFLNGVLHRITIEQDSDPFNPRTDRDNVGTMVCWHRNYKLGDEQPKMARDEYRKNLAISFEPKLEDRLARIEDLFDKSYYQLTGPQGRQQWSIDYANALDSAVNAVLAKHIIELPLYLYDHSGITMRTSAFSCRWDSGQVGFIYLTREKIQQEWGWKKLTKERREKLYAFMEAEVEEYDHYLTGAVYGFKHETAQLPEDYLVLGLLSDVQAFDILQRNVDIDRLDWDEQDSCWGFLGHDITKNGILDYIPKHLEDLARAAA